MPEPRVFGRILPGIKYVDRPGAYAFLLNAAGEVAVIQTSFGLFLPGGGVDEDEDLITALRRELSEEIGYEVVSSRFIVSASQYHWSEFYQSHFKKIGSFFVVEANPPVTPINQAGHVLLWLKPEEATAKLSQEFQRWAIQEYIKFSLP